MLRIERAPTCRLCGIEVEYCDWDDMPGWVHSRWPAGLHDAELDLPATRDPWDVEDWLNR